MKAVIHEVYGSPDVIELREIPTPTIAQNQMLVRVHAAAVNPLDWHFLRGAPRLLRAQAGLRVPKRTGLGADIAGVVESVGSNVTGFAIGDEIFGEGASTLAEYAIVGPQRVAHKPPSISFESAAAIPVAGITALQGLREHGGLKRGESVLINGASGGVGTFAVQLASSLGATTTGVCSTANVELVRSLGADRVIDYTREDFSRGDERYDLILDLAGNHSLRAFRRALTPEGRLVLCGGGTPESGSLGMIVGLIGAKLTSSFSRQKAKFFLASVTTENLEALATLVASGQIRPVIDRTYPLAETAEAIRYLETGRARGKVVITV